MSADPERELDAGLRTVAQADGVAAIDSPPHITLSPGMVVAEKYQLVAPLGEGGMGSVWVALNTVLNVRVALKVLRAEARAANRAAVADRMLQEARAAARFTHPAVVRVNDFGKLEDGDPFFVMELLEGDSLGDVLERRGQLPAIEAVQTLLPIAHALVAAHEKKIVHRDLKPDNVMLAKQEDGGLQPKIIDFGIAKWNDEASSRVTIAGTLLGSPAYMAPEQARGEDVDPRSDIWAFCIVLYEAVTGTVPFHAPSSHYALIRAIIDDRCTTILERGVLEPELSAIIDRGLQKNPDQRWQSMRDLGAALAEWLLEREVFEDLSGASVETSWLRRRMSSLPDSMPPARARVSHSSINRRREAVTEAHALLAAQVNATIPPAPESVSTLTIPAPRRQTSAAAVIAISTGVTLACVALYVLYGGGSDRPAQPTASETPREVATAAEAPAAPPAPVVATETARAPVPEPTIEAPASAASTSSARPKSKHGPAPAPSASARAPTATAVVQEPPGPAPLPTLKRPDL